MDVYLVAFLILMYYCYRKEFKKNPNNPPTDPIPPPKEPPQNPTSPKTNKPYVLSEGMHLGLLSLFPPIYLSVIQIAILVQVQAESNT